MRNQNNVTLILESATNVENQTYSIQSVEAKKDL